MTFQWKPPCEPSVETSIGHNNLRNLTNKFEKHWNFWNSRKFKIYQGSSTSLPRRKPGWRFTAGAQLWNAVDWTHQVPKCIGNLMTRFFRIENIYHMTSSIAYAPKGFYLYELSDSRSDSFRPYIRIICSRKDQFEKIIKHCWKMFKKVGKIRNYGFSIYEPSW